MIHGLERYLKENIDDDLMIEPWDQENKLSINLRETYIYHRMTVLGVQCVLLEVRRVAPSIDQIKKHIRQIQKTTDHQIVLYYKEISRYRRKSLIDNRISFVIENGQMYLPFLGVDLKKTTQNIEEEPSEFSASTQVVYLYFLYHENSVINATELSDILNFSIMTASRALNILYDANLLAYTIGGKTGRSKNYRRISNPLYFLKGRDYLRTPVVKTVHVTTRPPGVMLAGQEALAALSMINPPDHHVYAISNSEYKNLEMDEIPDFDAIKDLKPVEVELWTYDPRLLSDKDYVDVLSLYLSLKDETDERVDQALADILRSEGWYTD